MTVTNESAADIRLPPLREDLKILEGPINSEGAPTWNIFDAVRNRYFRVGWAAFQLLSRWREGSVDKLLESVNTETTCRVTQKDIDDLLVFLYSNSLTISTASNDSADYLTQLNATKQHWIAWLLKNYLFVRIPLIKPNTFLKAMLPLVEPLMTVRFRNIIFLIGVLGLYLAAREWEVFINSFLYFFNTQGLLAYFCALVFIKVLHEFGHGFVATRYGAKIGTMGVAFLVMFPILYTDTSDAWRINSRRQRLHIGIAGVMTELYIACIATFAWAFMPDGVYRSMAFILATSSWVLSLTINLNILMRFDGYYILSDWWGVENLQNRSFAMGRWRLGKLLFGLNHSPPESMSDSLRRKLTIYAWVVWIYRFFLFLGIALLVYYFFFKLLGIILFVVEILYFIVMPIYRQCKSWWQVRSEISKSKRAYVTFTIMFTLLLLCFIPWNTKIRIPAILEATENVVVYSPVSAQIKSIYTEEDQLVKKGDLIAVLESRALQEEIGSVRKRIDNYELLIKRQAASPTELANIHVILSQLEESKSEYQGLQQQANLLEIYSPIDGVVADIDDAVHEGRWVNPSLPLFNLVNRNFQIVGVLDESNIVRVHVNQSAIFYPDNIQLEEIASRLIEIESANTKYVDELYFNSQYGGGVPVRQDDDGNFVPESGVYKIILLPLESLGPFDKVVTGVVHVEGEPRSLVSRLVEVIATVFIRESGF